MESDEVVFIRDANNLLCQKRQNEAISLVRAVIGKKVDISPKTKITLKHIEADCWLDKCQFQKAIRVFNSILSVTEDSYAYANRGLAYWEKKEYKKALNDYLRAIAIDPRDAITQRSAGQLLTKLRRYRRAIQHLKKSISLDKGSTRSFCALGIAYFKSKDWLLSYRTLKKALAIDPANKTALLGIKKIESFFDLR